MHSVDCVPVTEAGQDGGEGPQRRARQPPQDRAEGRLQYCHNKQHLLRGFRKYRTLGVFREIMMKLLFRLGKANLLERLYNHQSESQDLAYL